MLWLLGRPALLLWLLLLPRLRLGWLRRLLNRCRLRLCLCCTLAERPPNGRHRFGQARCFLCRWRGDEFGQGDDPIPVGVGLSMEFGRFFKTGAGGLSQFLNVEGTASVLISGNEVLGSADELRLFLSGGYVRVRRRNALGRRFGLGNQFGAERTRKRILCGLGDLLFTLDIDGRFIHLHRNDIGKSDGACGERNDGVGGRRWGRFRLGCRWQRNTGGFSRDR